MKAEERAKEVVQKYRDAEGYSLSANDAGMAEYLAEAILEAEKEAYDKFRKDYRWACQCMNVDCALEAEIISRGALKLEQKGYAEGWTAGRDQAAKICHESVDHAEGAERIMSMKRERE